MSKQAGRVIRNAVGVKGIYGKSRTLKPYVDLAYVYEERFSGLNGHESFVDTNQSMSVRGYPFTHNLAKLNVGFTGSKKDTSYQINIQGLYGHHRLEQTISLKLDRKF